MVSKKVEQSLVTKTKHDELVYVRYKFKYEDKVIFKLVSRYEFEELKDAFTIEFCDLMN